MSLPSLQTLPFKIEILTEQYQIVGVLEVFGMLTTFMNQNDRINYQLKHASIIALDTSSTMAAIQLEDVWIRRDEIVLARFIEGDAQGLVQRLPVAEKMRIFLPRFVVQGSMLRGTDTSAGTLFEAQAGPWAAVTDAQVFPLTVLKSAVFRDAPLLLINKSYIRFYEIVKEPAAN